MATGWSLHEHKPWKQNSLLFPLFQGLLLIFVPVFSTLGRSRLLFTDCSDSRIKNLYCHYAISVHDWFSCIMTPFNHYYITTITQSLLVELLLVSFCLSYYILSQSYVYWPQKALTSPHSCQLSQISWVCTFSSLPLCTVQVTAPANMDLPKLHRYTHSTFSPHALFSFPPLFSTWPHRLPPSTQTYYSISEPCTASVNVSLCVLIHIQTVFFSHPW